MEKVNFYFDGLNLYNGLKKAKLRKYYWLDLYKLAKKLCIFNQKIKKVKYFTSMVSTTHDVDKYKRQSAYIKALRTSPKTDIIFGRHQRNKFKCFNPKCGRTISKFVEKMTDVNIAVEMIKDAYLKNCDTQILISGDSDLIPACETLLELFKNISLVIYFPPKRQSNKMKIFIWKPIYISIIKSCQFPEIVIDKKGNEIIKPTYWN